MEHLPILPFAVADALLGGTAGDYVDATFGRGGHARLLLDRLGASSRLLVIDRDPEAITVADQLAAGDPRVRVAVGRFGELRRLVFEAGLSEVAGVLMDLGVSSPQLDDPVRGFSFRFDAPLDMRMDPTQGATAADWLNSADEAELSRVFKDYGEERFARRIARAVVQRRSARPLKTTADLVEIIEAASPRTDHHKHAATRVFQAVRIQINGELEELERGLDASFEVLADRGRLAVLSFHSLEDRIVKRRFQRWVAGESMPRRLPVPGRTRGLARWVVKSQVAGDEELAGNPRARSARLRVIEKLPHEERP